jgi:RNA polymerase sigma factor (TIGR02999 family)
MPASSDPTANPPSNSGELTQLLQAWTEGDALAGDELFRRVYPELRAIAARSLAAEPSPNLQTTELVHEAYVKLVGQTRVSWQCRAHFFAVAARQVRRILVDLARHRYRQKRGSGAVHLSLDGLSIETSGPDVDLVALDDALTGLREVDARAARIVELRFFAGLSVEETAEVLGAARATIFRGWRFGRAWLARHLRPS